MRNFKNSYTEVDAFEIAKQYVVGNVDLNPPPIIYGSLDPSNPDGDYTAPYDAYGGEVVDTITEDGIPKKIFAIGIKNEWEYNRIINYSQSLILECQKNVDITTADIEELIESGNADLPHAVFNTQLEATEWYLNNQQSCVDWNTERIALMEEAGTLEGEPLDGYSPLYEVEVNLNNGEPSIRQPLIQFFNLEGQEITLGEAIQLKREMENKDKGFSKLLPLIVGIGIIYLISRK